MSHPTFFSIGTDTPLNVSGTTPYCTHRVNIRVKHLGRELSKLYNNRSAVIPSFEGEQFNFNLLMYFIVFSSVITMACLVSCNCCNFSVTL